MLWIEDGGDVGPVGIRVIEQVICELHLEALL